MGLTMNQWDQLAGGSVEGYLKGQTNRRDNEKNKREQDAEDRTATKWEQQEAANKTLQERIARQEFEAIVQASNTSREAMDSHWGPPTPAAGLSGGPAAPAAPAPVAPVLPQAAGALPPPPTAPTVPSTAAPYVPPAGGIGGLPVVGPADGGLIQVGAANGGAVEVGPEQMGPPQPQPQMGPPQQEALPTQPAQPAYKDRREEYQAWYKKAAAAHATAGGLEGLQMFRDQENALSRKQMLGYGMEGVSAMQAGNAGEAVKQLNTMLAVSPEDTGMEWQAYDGKVYLVGPNGKRGKPFNQAAVQGIIENNIKTPENYLDFQEQARKRAADAETARSALITEGISQQNAESSTSIAETNAGRLAEDKKYRGRETAALEGRTLAALMAAKAANARAAALGASNGWSNTELIRLMENADSWSLNDLIIPKGAQGAYTEDSIEWGRLKSDVMNQMGANKAAGGPTREEASHVSMFLREIPGADLNRYKDKDGQWKGMEIKQDEATGVAIVNYEGKTWMLPYSLGVIALSKIPNAKEPPRDESSEEGGGKEEGAIPDKPRASAGAYGAPEKVFGAVSSGVGAVKGAIGRGMARG